MNFKIFICPDCKTMSIEPEYIEGCGCPKCGNDMEYIADFYIPEHIERKIWDLAYNKMDDVIVTAVRGWHQNE